MVNKLFNYFCSNMKLSQKLPLVFLIQKFILVTLPLTGFIPKIVYSGFVHRKLHCML